MIIQLGAEPIYDNALVRWQPLTYLYDEFHLLIWIYSSTFYGVVCILNYHVDRSYAKVRESELVMYIVLCASLRCMEECAKFNFCI